MPGLSFTIFLDAAQPTNDQQNANHRKQPTNPASVEAYDYPTKAPSPLSVLSCNFHSESVIRYR